MYFFYTKKLYKSYTKSHTKVIQILKRVFTIKNNQLK